MRPQHSLAPQVLTEGPPPLALNPLEKEDQTFRSTTGQQEELPGVSPQSVLPQSTSISARNIVLLLDGTSNQISSRNTNVIKMMSVLAADETQLLYYSSGVGTILPVAASTWGKHKQDLVKLVDQAFTRNFADFVCDAYRFLMDYYRSGDKVYLFGFSRGAYEARALAGMVQKVGLLPAGNHNQIRLSVVRILMTNWAWDAYAKPDAVASNTGLPSTGLSESYRKIFGRSREISMHFIGAWDTVSSLGGVSLPSLPFAQGVKSVSFFRHALALNERRVRFSPEYRHISPSELAKRFEHPNAKIDKCNSLNRASNGQTMRKASGAQRESAKRREDGPQQADQDELVETSTASGERHYQRRNVECWFMGCHADVGGGVTQNGWPGLADISFRWMLREAAQCGLRLSAKGIRDQPAIRASRKAKTLLEQNAPLNSTLPSDRTPGQDEQALESLLSPKVLEEIVKLAAEEDTNMDSARLALTNGTWKTTTLLDVLSKVHESMTGFWGCLEHIPMEIRRYAHDGTPVIHKGRNRGAGRQIMRNHTLHASLLLRFRLDRGIGKTGFYVAPPAVLPTEWESSWSAIMDPDRSERLIPWER